jgi:RimJ/RimL family protein N-acetyltransferase
LLLRAYRVSDAAAVFHTMLASYEQPNRWMDWVKNAPKSVQEHAKKLREMRATTLAGKGAAYGVFMPDESALIGAIGLHPRIGAGALEIGYWIGNEHARQGYISEAAAALTRIAFETHGVRRMEIHTAPDNAASLGVARKIGFQPHTIIRECVLSATSPVRDDAIWAMTREQFAASPSATMVVEFDRRKPR